jgi:hypothetical protein
MFLPVAAKPKLEDDKGTNVLIEKPNADKTPE